MCGSFGFIDGPYSKVARPSFAQVISNAPSVPYNLLKDLDRDVVSHGFAPCYVPVGVVAAGSLSLQTL
jgi:hypothetical protein